MDVGDHAFPVYRFAIVVIGLIVFAGIWWLANRTRMGAIVRAGMDDKEMTMALGINYGRVSSSVFMLGAALAGLCGFLAAPWFAIQPYLGFNILMLALIAVVIGGVGNIQGTLIGAIMVGLIDSFSKALVPDIALFTPYIAFVIILLVRPRGLLGRKI